MFRKLSRSSVSSRSPIKGISKFLLQDGPCYMLPLAMLSGHKMIRFLCSPLFQTALDIETASDPNSTITRQAIFLIDRHVLYEICCFGMTDNDIQVKNHQITILQNSRRGKQILATVVQEITLCMQICKTCNTKRQDCTCTVCIYFIVCISGTCKLANLTSCFASMSIR
jgi:hypothetical protein